MMKKLIVEALMESLAEENGTPSKEVSTESPKNTFLQEYIGEYVICRTRNEGVNAGVVSKIDETGVVLNDCRRLWHHKPKDKGTSWYEGVAKNGLSDDSRVSEPVTKVFVENYSLTLCSEESEKSIRSHESSKQS